MMEGYRQDFVFPRVYEKNKFTKEDLEVIGEMLQDENVSTKHKKALLSMLRAYCKGLYCSECQGSRRTSRSGGVCEWNNSMPIDLPLNDGPLRSYPAECPIRKLIK